MAEYPDTNFEGNIAVTAVLLVVCVLGLLANLLVILTILLLREYKESSFHRYVLQLAIADCAFLLSIPFYASETLRNEWIFSEGMCKAFNSVLFLNCFASIQFLTVMSINRYVAVCHPFSSFIQTMKKGKVVLVITLCVWGISLLITIPIMMYSVVATRSDNPNCKCSIVFPNPKNSTEFCMSQNISQGKILQDCIMEAEKTKQVDKQPCRIREDYDNTPNNYSGSGSDDYDYLNSFTQQSETDNLFYIFPRCNYLDQPVFWTIYLIFIFVAMFILPFIILVVFYGMIVFELKAKDARKRNSTRCHVTDVRDYKDRRHVAVMCAALVGSFIICWLPFYFVHLAKLVGIRSKYSNICEILPIIGSSLAYLNSALNPYLYTFLGRRFISKFKSLKHTPEVKRIAALVCCNTTKS